MSKDGTTSFGCMAGSEQDLNATFAIEDAAGARPRLFFQRVPERKDYGYFVVMADPEANEICVD
jgi:hypothetical protein